MNVLISSRGARKLVKKQIHLCFLYKSIHFSVPLENFPIFSLGESSRCRVLNLYSNKTALLPFFLLLFPSDYTSLSLAHLFPFSSLFLTFFKLLVVTFPYRSRRQRTASSTCIWKKSLKASWLASPFIFITKFESVSALQEKHVLRFMVLLRP